MLVGTREELKIACTILRRMRFRDPEMEISVHDFVRILERSFDDLVDGEPVARRLVADFIPQRLPSTSGR